MNLDALLNALTAIGIALFVGGMTSLILVLAHDAASD